MLYLVSQVVAFLGIAVDLVGRLMKNKKWILILSIIACSLYVLSYIIRQSLSPAIIMSIDLVRNLVYSLLNRKNKSFKYYLLPLGLTILGTVICVIIFWSGCLDLLMLVAMTITAVGLAQKNMLAVRLLLVVNSLLWGIYNFTLGAYVNMACDGLNICFIVGAIIFYHWLPKHRQTSSQFSIVGSTANDTKS